MRQLRFGLLFNGLWLLLWDAALVFSLALLSPWPFLFALGFTLLMAARSAWLARWKCGNPVTLLLYGLHSHLQQIPILFGQWQYARDQKKGLRRGLIEYKEPAK